MPHQRLSIKYRLANPVRSSLILRKKLCFKRSSVYCCTTLTIVEGTFESARSIPLGNLSMADCADNIVLAKQIKIASLPVKHSAHTRWHGGYELQSI